MAKDMYQKRKERKSQKLENSENQETLHKTSINWYPGHMAKTKRLIKERIKNIDIVLNIVDSRIPLSSKIIDFDDVIKDTKKILVMSKYDLCDQNETKKWIKYYKELGHEVVTCDLKNTNDCKKIFIIINKLMESVNDKREKMGLLNKKVNVLVLGVPNVGKSTLINQMVKKKVTETGNKPGITKSLKDIRISDTINFIDTPGILWSKMNNPEVALNLASMTSIKEEVLDLGEVSCYILKMLSKYYNEALFKNYNIKEFDENNIVLMYETIALKRGIPKYKGEPDYERINNLVLNDIKAERIKGITFDRI